MENHISLLFHLLPNQVDLCQLGSVKIHYNIYKAGAISSGQRLSSWRDFWGEISLGEKNGGVIAVDKIAVGGHNLATRPSLIHLWMTLVLLFALEHHRQHHHLLGVHLFPALLLQQRLSSGRDFWAGITVGEKMWARLLWIRWQWADLIWQPGIPWYFFEWLWCFCLPLNIINSITSF